jgi:hypothetical protein
LGLGREAILPRGLSVALDKAGEKSTEGGVHLLCP